MKPAQGSRLDSWKAIAEYLDRNIRTVTRWAHERGLPVHHVPGGKRGVVFAYAEEIDAWLGNHGNGRVEGDRPTNGDGPSLSQGESSIGTSERTSLIHDRQHPNGSTEIEAKPPKLPALLRSRFVLWAAAAFFAAVLIALMLRPSSGQTAQISSVKYVGDSLEAQDAQGRTMWVHRYPKPFGDFPRTEPARVADFLGDGSREIAAIVNFPLGPNPEDEYQREVDFFSPKGKLLWSYAPEKTFRFGTHELKSPWAFQDLLVSQSGPHTTLWAAAGHRTWGNTFVAQIDPRTGQDTLRFVNTGALHSLNELKTASGTFLLAGGFNNEWDGGSLAIVNEARPFAASPQTPGTRHYCNSCPPGVPDYYFVFPRSEINRLSSSYENSVFDIRVVADGIEVRKYERIGIGIENTLYLFSLEPPFVLRSLRYDSDYDMLHKAWSAAGKLSHSLENCPERLHPEPVRLWTPASNWVNVPVKPAKADQ